MNRRPWYVYVLAGVILIGLFYIAYLKPKQAELKRLREERTQVEDEVAKLKAKKQQLDKIESEIASLNKSFAELEVIIPRKKEISEILRNVQRLAVDSQLDVIRFAPDKETTREFYSEWPIPIEIVGNYHNLGMFFDHIMHFPRIFNIDDFSIKALPSQTDEATISALFTAKTYFFLDESQIKKPEAPKPKKPTKESHEVY
jgi:type IV pilus assembly protein PilO